MSNYRGLFTAVLAALVLQSQFATAQDDEEDDRDRGRNSNCTSNLGGVEQRGTLNVTGPCQLSGADVRGDVLIFAGGSLVARDTRIRGNLDASRADFVQLDGVRVDRNVSLQELVGDSSRIDSSDLRGNVMLTDNRSRFEILDNDFSHDLGAFGNTGGLQIAGNAINGDLNCLGNTPAPTLLGNRIEGTAQGQCGTPRPQPTQTPPQPTPMPTTPPTTPRPSGSSPPPSTPTTPNTPTPAPPAPAAPPATVAPPPPAPAAATPPAPAPEQPALDDGGAGALGWPFIALLLPLVACRRLKRARADRERRIA